MKSIYILLAGLVASVFFIRCSSEGKVSDDLVLYNSLDMENRVLNFETTRKDGGAHGGKYYSSVDSAQRFAVGYSYIIPDSLKSRTMTVYVSAWIRESETPIEGGIAFSLSNSKGNIAWREASPKKGVPYNANEWVEFKDSMTYSPTMFNDTYVEIGVIGIKTYGRDRFDIDDFQVKYKFSK